MKQPKNILIVGVGGQGILLASELLSEAAMEAGYDVKKSEVHGMAQRGGVVSSHVRMGEKIFSPLIKEGTADVLLAFEIAEALRWNYFVKSEGTAVVNSLKLVPPIALFKGFQYPMDPIRLIKERSKNVRIIEAARLANELGNSRTANIILVGAISKLLPIPESIWKEIIFKRVPRGTEEINLKAFQTGRKESL